MRHYAYNSVFKCPHSKKCHYVEVGGNKWCVDMMLFNCFEGVKALCNKTYSIVFSKKSVGECGAGRADKLCADV
jgi:hypothetical protein